ncbi:histone acetyltransferase, GCN5-like, putative [Theileria annulata]|uniref:Histone acetyltransferase, GCN5-like, putative n=1 Tax=Theileria annulata TaxID=5874 RepID=Q4UE29_THEAN|nr:histone acetyltransferase, GCN5-like, putative [Theileria annulata]CAI74660.1 histone acetyltransferase, GCN5-like, putative [Theileria annulata]|eukprot:XP_952392.1 histone acetyltransferase, GCN5-like, putative [Theileria annulata]
MNNNKNQIGDIGSSQASVNSNWNFIPEDELKEQLRKFKYTYVEAINKLIKFDKQRIFRFPVDTNIVTDYYKYIKHPMDFETMLNKNDEQVYKDDIRVFDNDVKLIIENCKTYNSPDTVFYEAAVKLEEFYNRMRPILTKRINTICNLLNRKILSNTKSRNKPIIQRGLTPPLQSTSSRSFEIPVTNLGKSETSLLSFPSTESISSQDAKAEYVDISTLPIIKRKRKKGDLLKQRPSTNLNELIDPLSTVIQLALTVSRLSNETFGKLMSNFNGLPRLLNSLDVAHHQLSLTNYTGGNWDRKSLNRLKRVINNFEWKRSFDFQMPNGRNHLYQKIQLLLGRIQRNSYKRTVEKFIGAENLKLINQVIPNLSNTLNELSLPYQMLFNDYDLRF